MYPRQSARILVAALLLGLCFVLPAFAAPMHIGVQANALKKLAVLEDYLESKGVEVELVPYANNDAAVGMVSNGHLEALITGSGLGATLIHKGVGTPLLRPVDKLGRSTYWAVVLAPKGSQPFDGSAAYFKGKRVAFPSLASSGEFFYRALPGIGDIRATIKEAPNHQDAIDMLSRGEMDVVIVKNTAWTAVKSKYPNLVEVGSDGGQNPNDTLIATKSLNTAQSGKLATLLLGLAKDQGDAATKLKEGLGIFEYTITTVNDFNHTFDLMRKAGALR